MTPQRKERLSKVLLGFYYAVFLLFLYGPMIVMSILSLQGSAGGATFPARGLIDFFWYDDLASPGQQGVRDAVGVSLALAIVVGLVAGFLALSLAMAYRRLGRFSTPLMYLVLLSLMTPGLLLSLGLLFWWDLLGLGSPDLYPTVLGAHVVWALPFGFLIMVAIFNRYDESVEEAARDLGASAMGTFFRVTLPIVWTGIFGASLFGFVLSWNEFERTLLVTPTATLPIEIFSQLTTTVLRPSLYALGALTTVGTLLGVLVITAGAAAWARRTTRLQAVADEELREQMRREELGGQEVHLPGATASS
jgi:putative spermidine/putrescine transport system permease protein